MLTRLIETYRVFIGIIAISFGIFMFIFGYKFLKASFVIIMILISITFFIWIYYNIPIEKSKDYGLWATIIIGIIFGIVLGYFLIKINSLIYFCIGGYLGYLVGNILLTLIILRVKNDTLAYIAVMIIFILVCGFISYKLSKHIIITTTSLIGVYFIVRGVSFYFGHFPNESVIFDLIKNHEFDQLKKVSHISIIFFIF